MTKKEIVLQLIVWEKGWKSLIGPLEAAGFKYVGGDSPSYFEMALRVMDFGDSRAIRSRLYDIWFSGKTPLEIYSLLVRERKALRAKGF